MHILFRCQTIRNAAGKASNPRRQLIPFVPWQRYSLALVLLEFFSTAKRFDSDISRWNVSNVQDLSWLAYGATSFSRDLKIWGAHLQNRSVNVEGMFELTNCRALSAGIWSKRNARSFNFGHSLKAAQLKLFSVAVGVPIKLWFLMYNPIVRRQNEVPAI